MASIDNVEDVTPLKQYVATAGQTEFDFPFPITASEDIVVNVDGITKTLTTHYVVTGAGEDNGGTVTLVSPLAGGEIVTLYRDIPIERSSDFQQNGPLASVAFNDELDRIILILQQLERDGRRAIRLPLTNPQPSSALEIDGSFAGHFPYFNDDLALVPAAGIEAQTLTKSIIGGLLYPRTAAEISAGVTPTDYSYPAGNVRRYGAVGDGSTDDTAAFLSAVAALDNGGSIYVPAGDYIIDTECWLIRGKSNIRIYGDGEVSKVRVSGQTDSNPIKQDFHTTMAVDQCSYVTIENLCVESKGQNYGNTDAYGSLSGGDDRTNAIIENGGSALLVARSDNVTLRNIVARRCGSVAVVYLSACEEVVVENCFANARSLGYAGFAADNWAHSTIKTKRTYKFIDCRVSKEDATYSSKGGIVLEGDEIAGRLLNVEISGGLIEDCSIGGDAKLFGAAVLCQETRLIISGLTAKNCYMGLKWQKRGGAVDPTWVHATGCNFINNKVCGVYISVGSSTGGARMSLTGCRIITDSTSVWSGGDEPAVAVSSGISCGGIQGSDLMYISGCNISGAQHGIYAIETSRFELNGTRIAALNGGVTMYGGGTLNIVGGSITTTESASVPVYMATANLAASASSNTNLAVTGCMIAPAGDSTSDYAIQLTGNATLFATTRIRGNIVSQGIINVPKGSATVYDVDEVMLNTTRRVVAHGLTGSDTYVEVNLPKEYLPTYAYAVGSDGTARAVQSVTANQGGTRGLVRVRLSGDVRTHYDSANNVRVTLMQ